ncbi:MAG: ribonuclease III [Gammaproteobacteria bacterium]|nr:ribonuclease III [Gammaproteobacteria bacterium]
MKPQSLDQLMQRLGYTFIEPSRLTQAMSHRSSSKDHNERLEFLGDAALSIIIAVELFQRFPEATEGQLSRLRAAMVRRETLAQLARELQLGDYLILGVGELKSGGSDRDSILADTLEAVIGAIYLDAGMARCHQAVLDWWQQQLAALSLATNHKDAKTQLQEYLQERHQPVPHYRMVKAKGNEHSRRFTVECQSTLCPQPLLGQGSSRRKAEQVAAAKMLQALQQDE